MTILVIFIFDKRIYICIKCTFPYQKCTHLRASYHSMLPHNYTFEICLKIISLKFVKQSTIKILITSLSTKIIEGGAGI